MKSKAQIRELLKVKRASLEMARDQFVKHDNCEDMNEIWLLKREITLLKWVLTTEVA
jgi:hypothetical protein